MDRIGRMGGRNVQRPTSDTQRPPWDCRKAVFGSAKLLLSWFPGRSLRQDYYRHVCNIAQSARPAKRCLMPEAPDIICELVERFRDNRDLYTSQNYNEEQTRAEFIGPFFEALGWEVPNKAGR
ncbi:MAG: hypothetical protein NTU88_00280 [Armatimonadetes bacterium]|nr:hypothetical protein [Armatimonadota bacterium]